MHSPLLQTINRVFMGFRCNIVLILFDLNLDKCYYNSTQIVYIPHLLPLSFSLATLLLVENLGALGEASPCPPIDKTLYIIQV